MQITRRSLWAISPQAVQSFGQRHRFMPTMFLTLLIAWVAANWSAFTQFWWYTDDFARAATFNPPFSFYQGRPLEIIVPYLMHLDYNRQSIWLHQGIRLLQASLHILSALILARYLAHLVKRWVAYSAVLFFVFWPFHGESVLWLSALAYPLAALLSLCGISFLHCRLWLQSLLGAIFISAAVLVNQSAALAGLTAWVIFQGVFLYQQDRLHPRWWREGIWLISGYGIGVGVSRGFIAFALEGPGRAALPTDITGKLYFWMELNRQYLASPNYPWFLTLLHIALIGITLGAVMIAWWRHSISLRQAAAAVGLLASLSVIPYLTVLLTTESSPAWRILYLAPFVSVAVWLILQQSVAQYPTTRALSGAVIALFLFIYLPMNMRNAADYVNVFNADLQTLQEIERMVAHQQPPPTQVIVATYPSYLRTWELHDVTYMHYDSKKSVFLRDWTAIPFLIKFSTLRPLISDDNPLLQDPEPLQQCVNLCWADHQQQPWQFLMLSDVKTTCVCP